VSGPTATLCTTPPSGCPALIYDLAISDPGAYYVHARIYAESTSDDSTFWGFDGIVEAIYLDPPLIGQWQWVTGKSTVDLPAGQHALYLWERDAGTRIDELDVSLSATPP